MKGVVIAGKKAGRHLGFPTANIKVSSEKLLPGIYAGYVAVEGHQYQTAIYVAGGEVIEAFILDFSGNLYGKEVQVQMVKKIRDKIDFKDDNEAICQITKDVEEIKELLKKP